MDQRLQHNSNHTEPHRRENGNSLEHVDTRDHFLNITLVAQTLRTTNKWDLLKLRRICKVKELVSKTKCQPSEWEKIFTISTSDIGLISKM